MKIIVIPVLLSFVACTTETDHSVAKKDFMVAVSTTGKINNIYSGNDKNRSGWLSDSIEVNLTDEVTGEVYEFDGLETKDNHGDLSICKAAKNNDSIRLTEHFIPSENGIAWKMVLSRSGDNEAGHTLTIDIPVLKNDYQVFMPNEKGVMDLKAYKDYKSTKYGQRIQGRYPRIYTIPMISIFNTKENKALTITLSPEQNIPFFQIEWFDRDILRLRIAHVKLGKSKEVPVKLVLFAHQADYRSALKAYMDEYPEYFTSDLPRSHHEGAFWYHHTENHPPFDELKKQNVQFTWISFYNEYLGEYLPVKKEWYPYTYSRQWKIKETTSDQKLNHFIDEVHAQDMDVYAYFNITEYGGAGGRTGDPEVAHERRRSEFPDANVWPEHDTIKYSWENSVVMSPDIHLSYWPHLYAQFKEHFDRLGIDGFVIDRMDWASLLIDYRHHDGYTMIGDKKVSNMTEVTSEALRKMVSLAHENQKRVMLNAAWRVELLYHIDGLCNERAFIPGQTYLAAYRPISAWIDRECYDDMLRFESKLKLRLMYAIFPHAITPVFKISQQKPDKEMADVLEMFAPLFRFFTGKRQVMEPHCVQVTGYNDANLFMNKDNQYVIPVFSRNHFMTLHNDFAQTATVNLSFEEAKDLTWAYALTINALPEKLTLQKTTRGVALELKNHAAISLIVAGKGEIPQFDKQSFERSAQLKESVFGKPVASSFEPSGRPVLSDARTSMFLRCSGRNLGTDGLISVYMNGQRIGSFNEENAEMELGKTI